MRWRVVVGAMVVAVAGSAPVWGPAALQPFDFFRVRRVELVGVRYLAPETVVGAVALRPDASVWDRIGPLAERVRSLAGVGDASVSRRMPGTLRITVREVEPVALAAGADGMITVAADGRPLPYDPSRVAVDVPVVERPEVVLVAALAAVRAAEPSLFAQVASARPGPGGSVELDLEGRGVIRLDAPVGPEVVRAVAAVERDLGARSQPWRELDGRYAGWVVVRRPTKAEASS